MERDTLWVTWWVVLAVGYSFLELTGRGALCCQPQKPPSPSLAPVPKPGGILPAACGLPRDQGCPEELSLAGLWTCCAVAEWEMLLGPSPVLFGAGLQ